MKRSFIGLYLGATALSVVTLASTGARAADTDNSAPVVVVAPSPYGSGIERNRAGVTNYALTSDDLARTGSLSLTDALERNLPGVDVSDTQGNALTGDVNYRGFTASPLQGLPQGLAIYLNGQRMNEAFGDTMNWDIIPQVAVSSVELVSSNPVFGLNALGGSLNLRTKDGLSFRGFSLSGEAGSFGNRQGTAEYGAGDDRGGFYIAVDGGSSDGWRPRSGYDLWRGFGDFALNGANGALHFQAGASRSLVGVVGPTPVDMLAIDREDLFTYPQTTLNQAQFIAINFDQKLGGAWSTEGGIHWRGFNQDHVDGNDGDFEQCGTAIGAFLCLEDDAFPSAIRPAASEFVIRDQNNNMIPCPTLVSTATDTRGCRNRISAADGPRVPYGTIDRTFTRTDTFGGQLQVENNAPLGERRNNFVLGAGYDRSTIHFRSSSTLGLITPDLEVVTTYYPLDNITAAGVPGLGSEIHAGASVGYGPAEVSVTTASSGLYASDTIDLAPALSLTVGGRWNQQRTDMKDLTGVSPTLTGNHLFSRFNPAINLAWRVTEGIVVYGGYSETNRAPTPLELGCSDPTRPCLLENSLVADPPLNQVVSHTFEAGARGRYAVGPGLLSWSLSAFRTENDNDIISLASTLNGRGSYANVPRTRRQGAEGEIRFGTDAIDLFVNASYVQATYQFTGSLSSPNNPVADAAGNVTVTPCDRMGGIPPTRVKAGFDWKPVPSLTLGADAQYVSSQFLVGDEGNDNPKLPSYTVVGLSADYAVNDKISLFGSVTNLLDRDYATFGTYFEPEGVQTVRPKPLPASADEQTLTPAAPRAFFVGLRARF